jgi:serine/threonine protein kinase
MDVEMATEFANLMFESPTTETREQGENDVIPLTSHPREIPAPSEQQQQQQQQAYPPTCLPPLPIPEEVFEPSFRDRGVTRPTAMVIPLGRTKAVPITVEVMKHNNPRQAYMRIDSWRPRSLSHGGPEWGQLYLGYILERVNDCDGSATTTIPIFRQPLEKDVQRVAIKRLYKYVLDAARQRREHEDPDCEIFRMNTIGDDVHVLSCIEALEDDTYLYIISPYAEGQTLGDHIPLQSNDDASVEHHARILFHQLLQDLQYLHDDHAICHRDVSPGNCLVHNGRVVLNDLAMSHRIPRPATTATPQQQQQQTGQAWRRVGWISNFGCFGKSPYWPPEVVLPLTTGGDFQLAEGVHAPSCDLWAAVVILFHLVTGCKFYEFPYCGDHIFRIFVMCGGLAPTAGSARQCALLQRAWEELQAPAERHSRNHVVTIWQKLQRTSPRVQELLYNVFQMNPQDRWTMEEVLNCDWMKLGPG